MHFIHNKINQALEKPEISLNEFFIQYYNQYKTKDEKYAEYYKIQGKLIYLFTILGIAGTIYYLYDK
jgi:hypothetical protein